LERYCQKYTKNGIKYFGYKDIKTFDPVTMCDFITGGELTDATGWYGTYRGAAKHVKNKYGT
jgi:hypothetical protein